MHDTPKKKKNTRGRKPPKKQKTAAPEPDPDKWEIREYQCDVHSRFFYDCNPNRNHFQALVKYKSDSDVFQFFSDNFTSISLNGFSAAAVHSMNVFWGSLPFPITGMLHIETELCCVFVVSCYFNVVLCRGEDPWPERRPLPVQLER